MFKLLGDRYAKLFILERQGLHFCNYLKRAKREEKYNFVKVKIRVFMEIKNSFEKSDLQMHAIEQRFGNME